METKVKKESLAAKEDSKAKTEMKKKDVAEPKAGTKKSSAATEKDKKSGEEFRDFFIDELKDILWAERALLKALPKMRKAATGKIGRAHV